MTGLPITPDAIPLAPPPGGPGGPVAVAGCWDWSGFVPLEEGAAPVALVTFNAPDADALEFGALDRGARGARVGPALLPNVCNVRFMVPDQTGLVFALELRAGYGCSASPLFRGEYTVGATGAQAINGAEDFVQASGLVASRWELWGRVVTGSAQGLALRVVFDRFGGPMQLRWGQFVTKRYPKALLVLP